MRTSRVGGVNHRFNGANCRHCHRPVRKGQVVFSQDTDGGTTTFIVHAKCMRTLVDRAPADEDVESFRSTRNRILATGDPYTE